MRFGMVTTFYPPFSYGGDATYVRNLAKSLKDRGHEVEVITSTDAYFVRSKDDGQVDTTVDDGIKVHRLRHPAGLLAPLVSHQTGFPALHAPALKSFMAEPFDVLHFHNISLMGAPGVLGMGTARARLLSLHDHWLVCPTHVFWKNQSHACDRRTCFSCAIKSGLPPQLWRYTGLRERYVAKMDRLLAPSEFTARMHRDNGVMAPIKVLPLFSSLDGPGEQTAVKPNRIIFAGRVMDLKGIGNLVRVVADMPDIELLVIGDGERRADLTEQFETNPNIRFLGKVDQAELAVHYASAAAIIVPSVVPETFGLTLVEAAACGTPAIVAKWSGGAAEIIGETGGGLLYGSDEELVSAIRELTGNRDLRDRLSALARAGYQSHYTRDKHVADYLGHVDDVLGKRD
jgi:glycosyltransferase involved in cell wall biosynthesis